MTRYRHKLEQNGVGLIELKQPETAQKKITGVRKTGIKKDLNKRPKIRRGYRRQFGTSKKRRNDKARQQEKKSHENSAQNEEQKYDDFSSTNISSAQIDLKSQNSRQENLGAQNNNEFLFSNLFVALKTLI